MNPRYIFGVMLVVFIDAVIVSGWAASIVLILWGGFAMIFHHGALQKPRRILQSGVVAFFLTAGIGYGISYHVRTNFLSATQSLAQHPPVNKQDLLNRNSHMSWLTKYSLLSYSSAGTPPVAQFRVFPYRIEEYDLSGKVVRSTGFD